MIPELQKKQMPLPGESVLLNRQAKMSICDHTDRHDAGGTASHPKDSGLIQHKLPQLRLPFSSEDAQPLPRAGTDDLRQHGTACRHCFPGKYGKKRSCQAWEMQQKTGWV